MFYTCLLDSHSAHKGGGVHSPSPWQTPPRQTPPPPRQTPPPDTATAVDGTRPTVMHSCVESFQNVNVKIFGFKIIKR